MTWLSTFQLVSYILTPEGVEAQGACVGMEGMGEVQKEDGPGGKMLT